MANLSGLVVGVVMEFRGATHDLELGDSGGGQVVTFPLPDEDDEPRVVPDLYEK